MATAIIYALSLALTLFVYYGSKGLNFNALKLIKILSVVFCLFGLFRFLLADSFVETALKLSDPLQCFLRWGYHIGYAVIPLSIFFDSKIMRNVAVCFSLPVTVLGIVFYESTFIYFRLEGGGGFYANEVFVHIYYSLELILAAALPALMMLLNGYVPFRGGIREVRETLIALGGMLLIMIPSYIPMAIFGHPDISTSSFSTLHLGWIFLLAASIVALYFVFRKKTPEQKYLLVLFLTVAQFYHTNSIFLRGFEWSRLPIQLCSIAAYFYLFTVLTRKKTVFDFCFLVNLVGGVVAIALADFGSEAFSFWNIHYIYEHTFVMMVPILAYSLGIFGRVDRGSLKNALRIFGIYFVSSFVFGSLVNYILNNGYMVNFFYMFNYETAIEYVPFATFTGIWEVSINHFKIYPILILTVFVFFNLLFTGFYYLMRLAYNLKDNKHSLKAV